MTFAEMQMLSDEYQGRFGNLDEIGHPSIIVEPKFLSLLKNALSTGQPVTRSAVETVFGQIFRDEERRTCMNHELPAGAFTVADNDSALAIIIANGLADQFPKYEGPSKAQAAAIVYGRHQTHWLVILRFEGNIDPADNGCLVYGLPKTEYDRQKLGRFVDEVCKKHLGAIPDLKMRIKNPGTPGSN